MFSRLYGSIINRRNALYEKGVFKSQSLGIPVISVGNITVGGTGKTPLVALVAEILADKGEKVGILTRGYGRKNPKMRVVVSDGEKVLSDARNAGDEPIELAQKLLGKAVVIADANRVSAGKWARETFGISAFVLDDAFQHRQVRRDLDIVVIDATNPFGNEKTLPSGILREPLGNLKRADAIIISRSNLAQNIADLKARIAEYNSHCPTFVAENRISNLISLKEFHSKTESSKEKPKTDLKALAFCALGNPNNFFEQLRQENLQISATQTFSDHHFYTQIDLEKLSAEAKKFGAEVLLTTAKDAVKLKDLKFEMPCSVVETRIIFDSADDFQKLILGAVARFKPRADK